MTPPKSTFEVRSEVVGSLSVRIIDATLDESGFEHEMTRNVEAACRARGVTLERPALFPKTSHEFFAHLAMPGAFNCLVLVAHGETFPSCFMRRFIARLRGARATEVKIAGLDCPWLLIGQAQADLRDKIVALAVCGGHCPDAIFSFVSNDHLALMLLGSSRAVTSAEVEAVFPAFLQELAVVAAAKNEVNPEDAQAALIACNINDAFSLVSGVGILP